VRRRIILKTAVLVWKCIHDVRNTLGKFIQILTVHASGSYGRAFIWGEGGAENARLENAELENAAPNCRTGKRETGKREDGLVMESRSILNNRHTSRYLTWYLT